jgi:hypothetical protein
MAQSSGTQSSRKLVWLATCPKASQGVPSGDAGILRSLYRRHASLNDVACADVDVARLSERHNIDWEDYSGDLILALAEIEPLFAYDDLQQMAFPERVQCRFFQSLAFDSIDNMLFFRVLHVKAFQNAVEIADWAHIRSKAFFGDLDDATCSSVAAEWARLDMSDADDMWCRDSSLALPSEVLRLPLPFAVLCSKGLWSSCCICDLTSKANRRGGWRIGLHKSTDCSSSEPRFRNTVIPKGPGLKVEDVSDLNFYDSEVLLTSLSRASGWL